MINATKRNEKMKTFTELNTAETVRAAGTTEKVIIKKFIKDGTKRVFFAPVTDKGFRLNSTMFSALWCARKLAKSYLLRAV